MTASKNPALKDGDLCTVIAGTHKGKRGTVRDLNMSKTGHLTITVVQANGERFKTLGRNVEVQKKTAPAKRAAKPKPAPVKLLAGGNPQIPKGEAMPLFKPISPRCRGGSARSVSAWTPLSSSTYRSCRRP
jgi:ribosomal protein L24